MYTMAQAYREQLRRAGSKATPKRLAILKALMRAKCPLSVHDLAARIRGVDTTTVYRALEAFELAGLVERVDLGHTHAHYEYREPGKHHHHIVCTDCGVVEESDHCPSARLEQSVLGGIKRLTSFEIHTLTLYGRCGRCIV